MSYAVLAKVANTTVAIICNKRTMTWEEYENNNQEELKHQFETKTGYRVWKKQCKNCGKEFYTMCHFRVYCQSSECLTMAQQKRNEERKQKHYSEHVCSVCSTPFVSKRNDARFCSNACRQKAYRKKSV